MSLKLNGISSISSDSNVVYCFLTGSDNSEIRVSVNLEGKDIPSMTISEIEKLAIKEAHRITSESCS